MISLNLNAAAEIESLGADVNLIRDGKTIRSTKAVIDASRQGYFVAVAADTPVRDGDILASDNQRVCVVRRVASNGVAAIWLCKSAPKQYPKTGGK